MRAGILIVFLFGLFNCFVWEVSAAKEKGPEECLKPCTPENATDVCTCDVLKKAKTKKGAFIYGSKLHGVKRSCPNGFCSYCIEFNKQCLQSGSTGSLPCCGEQDGPEKATSIGCYQSFLGGRACQFACESTETLHKYRCYDSDGYGTDDGYQACFNTKHPNMKNSYTICPKNQTSTPSVCGAKGADCQNVNQCCPGYSCHSKKCLRNCILPNEYCRNSDSKGLDRRCCESFELKSMEDLSCQKVKPGEGQNDKKFTCVKK